MGRRCAAPAAIAAILLVALLASAAPAAAQQESPLLATVRVDPLPGSGGPLPSGRVTLSLDGTPLLVVPLELGLAPILNSPLVVASLRILTTRVTIAYSGDGYYDPISGITLTIPAPPLISLVAVPRDRAAPAIDILAPADGARFTRGERVLARYVCRDPQDRNPVTLCRGPVADGSVLDTSAAGSFTFEVRSEDAVGNAATSRVRYSVVEPPAATGGSSSPPTGASSRSATRSAPATSSLAPPPPPAAVPPVPDEPEIEPSTREDEQARREDGESPRDPLPAQQTTDSTPADGDGASERARLKPYDPKSEPEKVVATTAAAFTLLQLGAGGGGIALAGAARRGGGGGGRGGGGGHGGGGRGREGSSGGGASSGADASQPESEFAYEGVDFERLGGGFAAIAAGDRSRTWGWPGTRAVDAVGVALPARVAKTSPLAARALEDGAYLRAIFGAASLLMLIVGLVLGIAAVRDTGGEALPPVATLTIAIAILGVFDAAAGLVAVGTFSIGVLVLGGVDSAAAVRTMVGLSALWFAVPVLAGAARPLRRLPASNFNEAWERGTDFVIASLIGAWVVYEIVGALPGIAGLELPIADHAETAALFVLLALVARMALETLAAHLYPKRMAIAEPGELPEPGSLQRLGAVALRGSLFAFFAVIVVGTSWQLWVATALFVTPQLLAVFEERFPNSTALCRVLPRGLLELVLMLLVLTAIGALLLDASEDSGSALANAFVVLAIPGFALSLLGLFGRDEDDDEEESRLSWMARLGGIALVVLGVLLVVGALF